MGALQLAAEAGTAAAASAASHFRLGMASRMPLEVCQGVQQAGQLITLEVDPAGALIVVVRGTPPALNKRHVRMTDDELGIDRANKNLLQGDVEREVVALELARTSRATIAR